jgi:hypothetical protein
MTIENKTLLLFNCKIMLHYQSYRTKLRLGSLTQKGKLAGAKNSSMGRKTASEYMPANTMITRPGCIITTIGTMIQNWEDI